MKVKSQSLMLKLYLLATAFSIFIIYGLFRYGVLMPNTIRVDLDFREAPESFQAESPAAIAGGDKVSWPEIRSGFHRRFLLYPEMKSDIRFGLVYKLGEERNLIEGLDPLPGRAYKIHVKMDKTGQFHIDQCALPCWLR